ncbi:CPBP family intramembrane metalloprotease [Candidatus Saccharibacteria bacterium]|nr:CPBP family intramembrane metalloprotease [Candidatus Saccharibacteria bacterium]
MPSKTSFSSKIVKLLKSNIDLIYLPILAIITFYAAQFIVGVPMLIILGSDTLKTPLIATIFSVLVYSLSFIFLLFTLKHIKPLKDPVTCNELGFKDLVTFSDIGLAIAGLFGYFAFSAILTALFSVFPWFDLTETQPLLYSTLISPSGKILAAIALVVVGPILEEAIYRGLIYGKLRKKHSLITSILIVSILFGFLHGQWNVGVDVFALSVVACLMRETTGTIYAGIILHVLKNTIAFYFLFMA